MRNGDNSGFTLLETLAGFLLHQLGYIPAAGESVMYDGRTFVVEAMERNRIARVKVLNATQPADSGAVA